MSEADLSYIIPSRRLDDSLFLHIKALGVLYQMRGEKSPSFEIYCGEADANTPFGFSEIPSFKIVKCCGGVFHKMVRAANSSLRSKYLVFSTADDLACFSYADVAGMMAVNAKVGVGHFLLCRPNSPLRYRIFRGWIHFQEYMGSPPDLLRFERYIGEGPHTVWACYERRYFVSVAEMVYDLLNILEEKDFGIIEDAINLVNLLASDYHCSSSIALRFLDGDYHKKEDFVPSWRVYQNIQSTDLLSRVCLSIKEHLKRCNKEDSYSLVLSVNQIAMALGSHVKGYLLARSRKWREWIDVDWRPFEGGLPRIAASHDSYNPYLNTFIWPGRVTLNEVFPKSCWLANNQIVRFIEGIPSEIWRLHSLGHSS
jgi:hypothetical protein